MRGVLVCLIPMVFYLRLAAAPHRIARGPIVLPVALFGALILAGLAIACFAAYKIKAESFELSATILKLLSLSIKIRSPTDNPEEEPAKANPGDGP